ncbi:MAG: N-6 DNA methylase, partial [Bacteroidetes bacterium]|nr:N-6 DNA methylase [Bacteroidota bacterium]
MPNIRKHIFNRKHFNQVLSKIDKTSISNYDEKQKIISIWIDFIKSGNIYSTKESSIQGNFLNEFFSDVLGYRSRIKNTEQWNLNQEQLTTIDSKFADGSLGFFTTDSEDVRVVIELKDANTNLDERQHRFNDTRTPVEQAFSYQHKIGKSCKWVIVSNFISIRLYHHSSSTEYEEFLIGELSEWEKFCQFYYLLSYENLISNTGASVIDALYEKNEEEEQNISKIFYSEFKQARANLYENIKLSNPDKSELLLLEKTQKFLDRFIFICFCEDNRLLPEKTFKNIIKRGKESFTKSDNKIWNELKGFFDAINIGSTAHKINKFNGGLFAQDSDFDSLNINDSALEELTKLTEYDYESDIDVNILGHIFEQSITDIEEIKARIEGKEFDKKKSKRKKEGIYYTPEYITKYIVENSVGGWLDERKKQLGFFELPEIDFPLNRNGKLNSEQQVIIKKHDDYWMKYKEKLMNIRVLDPACGSGAFLNQAFNYLYAEGQKVNDKLAELRNGQHEIFDLDKHILSNNLFGVDLNSESVEITKLSLWIKTANNKSELTALDHNIKCGNSLIDDPEVAGDKAFNWFKVFPEVFPGFRDYHKKKPTPEEILEEKRSMYPDYSEIKERMLKEPSYSYESGYVFVEVGGFDVIICNPPYSVSNKNEREYLNNKYQLNTIETAMNFLKLSYLLLNSYGNLGYIVPKSLLTVDSWSKIRNFLLNNTSLKKINDVSTAFEEVGLETIIIIYNKDYHFDNQVTIQSNSVFINCIEQSFFSNRDKILTYLNKDRFELVKKIENDKILLSSISLMPRGITINSMDYIDEKNENFIQALGGTNLQRYLIKDGNLRKPNRYIHRDRKEIKNKEHIFKIRRIVYQNVVSSDPKIVATIVDSNSITDDTLNNLILNNEDFCYEYILALMNSKLFVFYLKYVATNNSILTVHLDIPYLGKFPIPDISLNSQAPFIYLVDTLLTKNKELMIVKNEFIEFIKNKFPVEKLSSKLQSWYELDYKG